MAILGSRSLTNGLLAIIALLLGFIGGWSVYIQHVKDKAEAQQAAGVRRARIAEESVRAWDAATDKMLLLRFEEWIEKKLGHSVSVDGAYVRAYQKQDVVFTDDRHATVTGILSVSGPKSLSDILYFSWRRPMLLDDSGQWLTQEPSFQQISEPPADKSGLWRNKALQLPKILRDPLPG